MLSNAENKIMNREIQSERKRARDGESQTERNKQKKRYAKLKTYITINSYTYSPNTKKFSTFIILQSRNNKSPPKTVIL